MTCGIDKAAFYTSHYFVDLKTLAAARGVDPEKFYVGLGQEQMAVNPPDEDVVTLAANAGFTALQDEDLNQIDMLMFATESGVDQSKAAGIFVHHLLNLPKHCRVVELKQACYSGTAGLQLAMSYVQQNPGKKVLLIASDIAKYGLNTTGESSQGGGAVAMLLSENPRLLAIENGSGFATEDAMDFWRPNYRSEALVEGKYSCDLYLRLLKETWQQYHEKTGRSFDDHQQFLFHCPLPRLVEKAYQKLAMTNGKHRPNAEELKQRTGTSLKYSRTVGNCYTASLYICLLSLLDNALEDLTGQRIGFYSYGSGCTAEYFSGVVQEGYQKVLCKFQHQTLLRARVELNQEKYEQFYSFNFPTDGSKFIVPKHQTGRFRLGNLNQHKRNYESLLKKFQTSDEVVTLETANR